MDKKELSPKIDVRTLKNGYAMTVDGKEYLFFTFDKLAAGFFYHVLMGQRDYANADFIEALMHVAGSFKDNEELMTAAANAIAESKGTVKQLSSANKKLSKQADEIDELKVEIRELRDKLARATLEAESYKSRSSRTYFKIEDQGQEKRASRKHHQKETVIVKVEADKSISDADIRKNIGNGRKKKKEKNV